MSKGVNIKTNLIANNIVSSQLFAISLKIVDGQTEMGSD